MLLDDAVAQSIPSLDPATDWLPRVSVGDNPVPNPVLL